MNTTEETSTPLMVSTFNTFGKFIFGYEDWYDDADNWKYLEDHIIIPTELNMPLYDLFISNLNEEIRWKHGENEYKDMHNIYIWDSLGIWKYQFEFNK